MRGGESVEVFPKVLFAKENEINGIHMLSDWYGFLSCNAHYIRNWVGLESLYTNFGTEYVVAIRMNISSSSVF